MPAKRPIYIDGYRVDLAIKEEHRFSAETTEHPTEQGSDITDHIRTLPDEISMDCLVSDTPIGEIAIARDEGAITLGDGEIADVALPSEEALAHLRRIRDEKRIVTIETSLGTFRDMALINLTVPRESSTTGGLFFSVSFKRIEIKENRRIARAATPAGSGKKDLGHALSKELVISGEVIWRKGEPPGAQLKPNYKYERVYRGAFYETGFNPAKGKRVRLAEVTNSYGLYHEDQQTLLTPAEFDAYSKDLRRDAMTKQQLRERQAGIAYLKQLQQNPGVPNNQNPQVPSADSFRREGDPTLGSALRKIKR